MGDHLWHDVGLSTDQDGILSINFEASDADGWSGGSLGVKTISALSVEIGNDDYDDPEDGRPCYRVTVRENPSPENPNPEWKTVHTSSTWNAASGEEEDEEEFDYDSVDSSE